MHEKINTQEFTWKTLYEKKTMNKKKIYFVYYMIERNIITESPLDQKEEKYFLVVFFVIE